MLKEYICTVPEPVEPVYGKWTPSRTPRTRAQHRAAALYRAALQQSIAQTASPTPQHPPTRRNLEYGTPVTQQTTAPVVTAQQTTAQNSSADNCSGGNSSTDNCPGGHSSADNCPGGHSSADNWPGGHSSAVNCCINSYNRSSIPFHNGTGSRNQYSWCSTEWHKHKVLLVFNRVVHLVFHRVAQKMVHKVQWVLKKSVHL